MELQVKTREKFGKATNSLRRQGLIPAELYGHGFENIHLNVSTKDFSRLFKDAGESTLIKLKMENGGAKIGGEINVLIHDVQTNPLTDEITHIDFYRVKMDEKITAPIPLEFVGEASAIKEKGGILVKAMQEIEIEAFPADLPHNIEVNLDNLTEIGMSIYVKDLLVDKKIKILVDPETVIATVTEPAKEEAEEKPISVEEVKVEGEEKKEEGEKEVEKKDEKKRE